MRWAFCVAFVLATRSAAHETVTTKLTWSQEISRIVYKRCAGCHREGGSAPMALLNYGDVRPWAKAIKEEVLARRMPPWGAVKGFGVFRNDPSLTQDEIQRIAEWVEGGVPEGNPVYLPAVPPHRGGVPTSYSIRKPESPLRRSLNVLGLRPLESVTDAKIYARLPGSETVPLIWLHNYRQEWKRPFLFLEPIRLPARTMFDCAAPCPGFELVTEPVRSPRNQTSSPGRAPETGPTNGARRDAAK